MDEATLRALLSAVAAGQVSPDDALRRLRRLPYADLGFAKVDHHRYLRQGQAEAVYGPGKAAQQAAAIVVELLAEPDGGPVLLTRATPEQAEAALAAAPGGRMHGQAPDPLTLVWRELAPREERVLVITAGTADLPVAGEAVATLEAYGFQPDRLVDCGVAGLHRLLGGLDRLQSADAVIVVAGMEGALASLVGGISRAPVVAVPTSVGYGAGLQGVTALLAMMASCAAGVSVVGIDNGFGAASAVARWLDNRRSLALAGASSGPGGRDA